MPLHRLSATALAAGYAARSVSPVEVARDCLARMRALAPVLNAFSFVDEDATLAMAARSEARWAKGAALGPLDGVPVSVKDLFATAGWPTRCGSLAIGAEGPWNEDAQAVARLRAAGAVLLGKTTTTEFGHKGVGDCPLTGVTRNPWNRALTTGGSSCGAGAAAAGFMGPLHLGSDGGGSIRIPAAFCGVVGFKPGLGAMPAARPFITGPLVAEGPLARTVADCALMLDVLAGPSFTDTNPVAVRPPAFTASLARPLAVRRIGYLPTISGAPVDPEIAASVEAALSAFRDVGMSVEEAALDLPDSAATYVAILAAGTAMLLDDYSAEQRSVMEPALLTLAEMGRRVSGVEYARLYHRVRGDYVGRIRALFERYDALVLPTMPCTAFPVMQDYPGEQDGRWRADWTPFTFPFNLTSQPACSLPCGLTRAGLPVGLQIVGSWGEDETVLALAAAFERDRPWPGAPEPGQGRPSVREIA